MADVKKITHGKVKGILRHVERTIQNSSNTNIKKEFTELNYSFIQREISAFDYYLQRKKELYCYNRADVKTVASWLVTAPKDLSPIYYEKFFQCVHEFLLSRYGGEKNCIQSICHYDEATPHLHFLFIPTQPDLKHGGEKICMCEVINREELRNFHPSLQAYLKECFKNDLDETGDVIIPNVQSGITKLQGGNRTILELKRQKEYEYQQEHTVEGCDW